MLSRRVFCCPLLILCVLPFPPSHATAAENVMRVLFVTQSKGFVHGSVKRSESLAPAEIALIQLGEQSGQFRVDCTQDCAADFTRENLQHYDIVAFYSTGPLPIAQRDLDYFFGEWLPASGHGVLGFHSAMDTLDQYEPYWDMIGGSFLMHPWTAGTTVTLTNHEPENPLTQPFGREFVIRDEIYMYRHWQPQKVRVLMSLNYAKSPVNNPVDVSLGYHVPVCWIKEYGAGRVYCNNLGHNEVTWTHPQFLASITAAVKWIRGDFDVDTTPNPEVSRQQEAQAREDFMKYGFRLKQ